MTQPNPLLDPDYALGGSKQRRLRRSAGRARRAVVVSRAVERDEETVSEYVMCVHCGRHWLFERGSGRARGWCMNCGGFTCGPGCVAGGDCVPYGQFLDNLEAGMPAYAAARHRPARGRVEAAPPGSGGE